MTLCTYTSSQNNRNIKHYDEVMLLLGRSSAFSAVVLRGPTSRHTQQTRLNLPVFALGRTAEVLVFGLPVLVTGSRATLPP